jgi:N-acetylglucosaminyl-diphospho-decaprenol L-rhamnosyltransferase
MAKVDVVVVSYNSGRNVRECVESLAGLDWVEVVVVDNASTDGSLGTVADLRLRTVALEGNRGFAAGCNVGWRAQRSPYVLFLNPDARIQGPGLRRLVEVLEGRPTAGVVAPRIVDEDGALQYSLRRFPRLRSTYAQALFLHRLAPRAAWADEINRVEDTYARPGPQEWVSGACMLVRREVLERLDGWDEGFFLYCEDIDLCRRVHRLGLEVYYEPSVVVMHEGGGSAPRSALLPFLAASRVRYAQVHRPRPAALAERLGIALEAGTRMLAGRGGPRARTGHARSLHVAMMGPRAASRPPREAS